MRIISGSLRGRKLNPPKLFHTRPTTDFAREGLFNMLNNQLEFDEIEVLDLYAGTGAVSLEFISRGAASVTCVDMNREAVKHISRLKNEWNVDNLEIIKADAVLYLKKCRHHFDVIFADPPYTSDDHYAIVDLFRSGDVLKAGGMLILEHDSDKQFNEVEGYESTRSFGKVNFSFFRVPYI